MLTFLLWCLLLVVCWPLALLALILYPIVWLILLPFRIVGIAVGGVFELLRAIMFLPARVARAGPGRHKDSKELTGKKVCPLAGMKCEEVIKPRSSDCDVRKAHRQECLCH